MIKTNRGVYPTRNGQLTAVGIEILAIQDDFENNLFKYAIGDFIEENGNKKYLSDRTINLSYAERDALKQNILQQISTEGMSESEVNKFILPQSLLYFVTNDFVGVETQTLIYGTSPQDWQIV
jgi:hypothetical protein